MAYGATDIGIKRSIITACKGKDIPLTGHEAP
jgi:hypothetical protein